MSRVLTALIQTYGHDSLATLIGGRNFVFTVSGLPVQMRDLVNARWDCRITHSRFGGRSKISFQSQDRRSSIHFRTANQLKHSSALELFQLLADFPIEGTVAVCAKPMQYPKTDEALLREVEKGIRRRLKQSKRITNPNPERFVKFMTMAV